MAKLSLNKAAAHACVAKSTILGALKSNDPLKKLSGEKNGKGHWEIDTSELDRVFSPTSSDQSLEPSIDPLKSHERISENSALGIEVKMLREQMDKMEASHDRERGILSSQIEDLKTEAERRSAEHMQALAVLTDQRERQPERRGLFGFFRKVG